MRKTEFLKLHLPDENEYYNVELDQNQNFIRVDGKLKEHDTALTKIQRGATNEQKGIVQFGIEEGKALEGNMLARLAGSYGFGGDIQNPGVKNQNYIYYDNNTRKMYKCLNQNSDTSANVQNYVPIDNFSFLERLENLMIFKKRITSRNGYFWVDIFVLSNQTFFTVISTGKGDLKGLESDEAILDFKVKTSFSSISGNSGTAGQLYASNNSIRVQSTDSKKGLNHSFFGQITTMVID